MNLRKNGRSPNVGWKCHHMQPALRKNSTNFKNHRNLKYGILTWIDSTRDDSFCEVRCCVRYPWFYLFLTFLQSFVLFVNVEILFFHATECLRKEICLNLSEIEIPQKSALGRWVQKLVQQRDLREIVIWSFTKSSICEKLRRQEILSNSLLLYSP